MKNIFIVQPALQKRRYGPERPSTQPVPQCANTPNVSISEADSLATNYRMF
jgi:hypothetical protein